VSPKGDIAKANNYALNQRTALTLYVDDGGVEIDKPPNAPCASSPAVERTTCTSAPTTVASAAPRAAIYILCSVQPNAAYRATPLLVSLSIQSIASILTPLTQRAAALPSFVRYQYPVRTTTGSARPKIWAAE
jgi:hypothetical protein